MNFDKAKNTLNLNTENAGYWQPYQIQLITYVIEELRKEYESTVEMSHQQAKIFASYYHPEKPIRKDEFDYPDYLLMKDISEKELTRAWLNPETIRIVGE